MGAALPMWGRRCRSPGHRLSDRIAHEDLNRDRCDAAVGAGLVDLDAPANDYLRSFRLVPVQPNLRPATVRHLLRLPPA